MADAQNPTVPQPQVPFAEQSFNPKDPMFLFGVIAFILNRLSDIHFNFPFAELMFPMLSMYYVLRENRGAYVMRAPGAKLAVLLILMITLSNIVNGVPFSGQFRNTLANITLFLPIFFFVATRDRKALMAYMLGSITGFCLYFLYVVGMNLALSGYIPRGVRGDQITPVVPIALSFLFGRKLPKYIHILFAITAVVSFGISDIIEVRATYLAVIFGIAFIAIARITPLPRLVLPSFVALGLLAHFLASFWVTSSFDVVLNSDRDTYSNLERAYAIDYSRMALARSPIFGNSAPSYAVDFNESFMRMVDFAEENDAVKTPHNTFLEYGVFFGYPTAFLLVFLICYILYRGAADKRMARSAFFALVCAGCIRMGAFYGFSGWLRVEWFALVFALYYNYKNLSAKPEQGALPISSPQVMNYLANQKRWKAQNQPRLSGNKA